MIELPEAICLSRQASKLLAGKRVKSAVANASPHAFAGYFGAPEAYGDTLSGRAVTGANAYGGHLEITLTDARLLLNDGASPRFLEAGEKRPAKHQLLMEFEDGSALACTVRMYGGIVAYPEGAFDNDYFRVAREKPSPLGDGFTEAYFEKLRALSAGKLSLKAFLATEQRVPGLGNGVLQDILYNARLHPRRRLDSLTDAEAERMYQAVRNTLAEMTALGGRDVERDLIGQPGGYVTKCSKQTVNAPCPACGAPIRRESYLGGAVYYCPVCQKNDPA